MANRGERVEKLYILSISVYLRSIILKGKFDSLSLKVSRVNRKFHLFAESSLFLCVVCVCVCVCVCDLSVLYRLNKLG